MKTYSLAFADTLISAARCLEASAIQFPEGRRAVLYLSLLSIEIALKSVLEDAGLSISAIKSRSHNLGQLLADLSLCEYEVYSDRGKTHWTSAATLRAIPIHEGNAVSTIGELLSVRGKVVSRYPNEIRYGAKISHYSPSTILFAASTLSLRIKALGTRARLKKRVNQKISSSGGIGPRRARDIQRTTL